jgi:hypothetical protein
MITSVGRATYLLLTCYVPTYKYGQKMYREVEAVSPTTGELLINTDQNIMAARPTLCYEETQKTFDVNYIAVIRLQI